MRTKFVLVLIGLILPLCLALGEDGSSESIDLANLAEQNDNWVSNGLSLTAAQNATEKVSETWYKEGITLLARDKNDEATKCFNESIQINPNNAPAWFGKGEALRRQNRYDEAIKCFNETIRINPNDSAAWDNEGIALSDHGKYR